MKLLLVAIFISMAPLAFAEQKWSLSGMLGVVKSLFNKKTLRSDLCKNLECPHYDVKMKAADYELRCYTATKWALTSGPVAGGMFSKGSRNLFGRLFKYISGDNEEKTKIKMTAPVRIERPLDGTEIGKGDMNMSFWVPSKFQASPPEPTNRDVHIMGEKQRCFYVRSFGGYILFAPQYMKHVKMLMTSLEEDKLADTYDTERFILTGYDSPYIILDRHNEVWLEKVDKPHYDALSGIDDRWA